MLFRSGDPPTQPQSAQEGELIAQVYIPRFGSQWQRNLVEGTSLTELNKHGLGHYKDSQMPGQVGNFAFAGHRNGYGQPLGDVDGHRLSQHAAEIAVEHHHIERLQRSRDLGQQVIEFADLGIGTGDRVLLQMPNTANFAVALFGLLRAGAVPVMCLPAHRRAELSHFATVSGAVALVIADRFGGFDYRDMARELVAEHPRLRQVVVDGDAGEFTSWTSLFGHGSAAAPTINTGLRP